MTLRQAAAASPLPFPQSDPMKSTTIKAVGELSSPRTVLKPHRAKPRCPPPRHRTQQGFPSLSVQGGLLLNLFISVQVVSGSARQGCWHFEHVPFGAR